MRRGEIWLTQLGRKQRPVLVLTRDDAIDVRRFVTVAEVTTSMRGLLSEVEVGVDVGLDRPSAINCDGLHTVPQSTLTSMVGEVDEATLQWVCAATSYAIGC